MRFQFVAIGTSLGGFQALKTVLGGLPRDFPLSAAIVQHRSYEDFEALAPLLSIHTQLPVIEVEDKDVIQPGRVYVCPSNYHLLVDGERFSLSTEAPVNYARPSIDVFFESAAERWRDGVIGVLLTGMSKDGAGGLSRIKANGGTAVVQDPDSAEGPLMPRTAIAAGAVDRVLPLRHIAPFLVELCAGKKARV